MRRFFLPAHTRTVSPIAITGPEARHIASVLRLKPGQTVEFFDGQGAVYTAILEKTTKNQVTATITGLWQECVGYASPLTLAQCLLKGKKMDLLVQKATELGVQAFLPVASQYCENHGDRDHQAERWQRIMIEACKQSHRTTPMTILPVAPLNQADYTPFSHRLAAWEDEQHVALPTTFTTRQGPSACCWALKVACTLKIAMFCSAGTSPPFPWARKSCAAKPRPWPPWRLSNTTRCLATGGKCSRSLERGNHFFAHDQHISSFRPRIP